MRFFNYIIICIAWIYCASGSVFATTILVEERFDYPDGPLELQNGGTGFTQPWQVSNNGGAVDSVVLEKALFSNRNNNGNNQNNNSTVSRGFVGFNQTSLELTLDYSLLLDAEGSYSYEFVLFDSMGAEVLSVGIVNDSYQVNLGGSSVGLSQNVNGTTFNDSLTFNLDFSDPTMTSLGVQSSITGLNTNGTDVTANLSALDFSGGGSIAVQSANLDRNGIAIDNIVIAIPEPSSTILMFLSAFALLTRRRRA